jgi:hypothetical protein
MHLFVQMSYEQPSVYSGGTWQALQDRTGQDMTWRDVTWRDVTWPDMTWHDMTWHDMTWHDMTWRDVTWRAVTWRDVTWRDVTWRDVAGQGRAGQGRAGQGSTGKTVTWSALSVVVATDNGQLPASVPLIPPEHGSPTVTIPASHVEGRGFHFISLRYIYHTSALLLS